MEQQLPEPGLRRIERQEILFGDRLRRHSLRKAHPDEKDRPEMLRLALVLALIWPVAAAAGMQQARDLMEAGDFEAAREMLMPHAMSGNADAEELIGVMYALGLGVEQDHVRAFDWYLRSAMKGHPGAQSGVGWYYELGLGMPAPDLVRAYLWYRLSTIGGDPDAALSVTEVARKMTREEIAKAHELVDDYESWMYPFQ